MLSSAILLVVSNMVLLHMVTVFGNVNKFPGNNIHGWDSSVAGFSQRYWSMRYAVVRRQAIIRTNDDLLSVESYGTHFGEIWIKIRRFPLTKMHSKMTFTTCGQFASSSVRWYNNNLLFPLLILYWFCLVVHIYICPLRATSPSSKMLE